MLAMVLGLLVMFTSSVFCQSSKDAIRSLKKLQAKVEVGTSYKDYWAALGDTKFDVEEFLASPEAKDKPELANSIRKTLGHYVYAKAIWDLKISGVSSITTNISFYSGPSIELRKTVEILLKDYPQLKDIARVGKYSGGNPCITIDEVIRFIWKESKEELNK
jgi:hypothetical protein